jgi:hypothetical protein
MVTDFSGNRIGNKEEWKKEGKYGSKEYNLLGGDDLLNLCAHLPVVGQVS